MHVQFEKKLRDAVWRQRNGLEGTSFFLFAALHLIFELIVEIDPVELAQLKDEALSLSRRYDDSIAKGCGQKQSRTRISSQNVFLHCEQFVHPPPLLLLFFVVGTTSRRSTTTKECSFIKSAPTPYWGS